MRRTCAIQQTIYLLKVMFRWIQLLAIRGKYDGPNGSFFLLRYEFSIPNSEFRILNSEFRILNSEFRISKKKLCIENWFLE